MTPDQFVAALEGENSVLLTQLANRGRAAEVPDDLTVAQLLRMALRNEYEALQIAAIWLADTREMDAKLALARQCGDEAKHYKLIEERLHALGDDLAGFDPAAPGPSPMLLKLLELKTTVERAAAGQFTREALAVMRNDVFAEYCDKKGDKETAALYRDRIQPDEEHHHDLGRRLLCKYAVTPDAQERARVAARATLHIAEEVQEIARLKGICRSPGC